MDQATPEQQLEQPEQLEQPQDEGPRPVLAAKLRELSEADGDRLLLDLVLAESAVVFEQQSLEAELGGDSPFFEMGLTSVGAVELRNRLVEATGLPLGPMLLFDYPTPDYVVEHLRAQFLADS